MGLSRHNLEGEGGGTGRFNLAPLLDLGFRKQNGLGFLTCGLGQNLHGSWACEKWVRELGGAHLFLTANKLMVYMILVTDR